MENHTAIVECINKNKKESDFVIFCSLAKYRYENDSIVKSLQAQLGPTIWIKQDNPFANEVIEVEHNALSRECNVLITSHMLFTLNTTRTVLYMYLDNHYMHSTALDINTSRIREQMFSQFPFVYGMDKAAAYTMMNNYTYEVDKNSVSLVIRSQRGNEKLPDQRYHKQMKYITMSEVSSWGRLDAYAERAAKFINKASECFILIQINQENADYILDFAHDLLLLLVGEKHKVNNFKWLVVFGSGAQDEEIIADAHSLKKKVFHKFLLQCQKFKFIYWSVVTPHYTKPRLSMMDFRDCNELGSLDINYRDFTTQNNLIRVALPKGLNEPLVSGVQRPYPQIEDLADDIYDSVYVGDGYEIPNKTSSVKPSAPPFENSYSFNQSKNGNMKLKPDFEQRAYRTASDSFEEKVYS